MVNKKVKQFLLSGKDSPMGKQGDQNSFIAGLFDGEQVINIGIQAPSGTQFYVNEAATPIIVGQTGIFEWDTEGYGVMTQLKFRETDVKRLGDDEYIMVNITYEEQSV